MPKDTYRFLRSSSLFLAFSFLFYWVAIVTIPAFSLKYTLPFIFNLSYPLGGPGHMHTRLREVRTSQGIDVLLLGSSHTYRGFDTRLLGGCGRQFLNMGSSAQTPVQTQLLLDEHLDRLSPNLVVYEVYPETLVLDGVESSLDIMANSELPVPALFGLAVKSGNVKVYNSFLLAMGRRLLRQDANFIEPRQKGVDTYIKGGYVERKALPVKVEDNSPREWSPLPAQMEAFAGNIRSIHQSGIPCVLVYAPITRARYESYANNRDVDEYMKSHGLPYFNFNEIEMGLRDDLHFADAHHLNQDGVEIFNKELLRLLDDWFPPCREPGDADPAHGPPSPGS
jgi:hypothetical protein